jgi:hypothetical protein
MDDSLPDIIGGFETVQEVIERNKHNYKESPVKFIGEVSGYSREIKMLTGLYPVLATICDVKEIDCSEVEINRAILVRLYEALAKLEV